MELKTALQNCAKFIANLNADFESESKGEAANVPRVEKILQAKALLSGEHGSVLLGEKESQEYQEVIRDLCSSLARRFKKPDSPDELPISQSAIESAVQTTIFEALDISKQSTDPFGERLASALDELKVALSTEPEDWMVEREVLGLASDCLPYTFGGIEFYVVGAGQEHTNAERDETKAVTIPNQEGRFGSFFVQTKGAVYARVPVKATDTNAAKILAERRLRLTLDVLNFFGDFFDVLESRVTLPGDATVSRVKAFVYPLRRSGEKHVSAGFTDTVWPLSFNAINETRAKESGFDRANAILANPSPSSLDDRILSSLQWAGRASIERRREEAFLLFCISLEALLLKKQKTETTQTFALRGAHLLVTDAAHRDEAFKDLKHLYGIRSSIVHSGKTQVNQADLSKIRWLAKTALLIALVREPFSNMKTEKELEDWFHTQLLAGVVVAPPSKV